MRYFSLLPLFLISTTMRDCELVSIELKEGIFPEVSRMEVVIEFDESYPVVHGYSLVLENGNGDISIEESEDSLLHVHYRILSRGHSALDTTGFITRDVSKERVYIEIKQKQNVSVCLEIETPYPGAVSVSLQNGEVKVDRDLGNLKVRTSNGDVEFRGKGESISLRTTNGSIYMTGEGRFYAKTSNGKIEGEVSPEGSSEFTTTNGSISLVLRGENIALNAQTTNGSVDVSGFEEVKRKGFRGRKVEGVSGNGSVEVHVKTTNGSISVERR